MKLFGSQVTLGLIVLLVSSVAHGQKPPQAAGAAKPVEKRAEQVEIKTIVPAKQAPALGKAVTKKAATKPKLIHGIFRFQTYPAAWTAAQKTNRPILIYITSHGCPHCVKMVEHTYGGKHVKPLVKDSFETVYVMRHQQPRLVEKLKIAWYPTTIIVTPSNKVIDKIEGYVDPPVFAQRVKTQLAMLAKANTLAVAPTQPRK